MPTTTISDDQRQAMISYLGLSSLSAVKMSNADLEKSFWSSIGTSFTRAKRVTPPASLLCGSALGESAWFAANFSVGMNFEMNSRFVPDYVMMGCAVASGNVQVALYTLARTADAQWSGTKVADSGVIACPTPGASGMPGNSIKIPFAAPVALDPGTYLLVFWADNVTVSVPHALSNTMLRSGVAISLAGNPYVGGLPSTFVGASLSGRAVVATLECAVPPA